MGGGGGDEEGGAGGLGLRVHVAAAAAVAALAGAAAAAASSAARHIRGCLGLDGGLDWCWLGASCVLLACWLEEQWQAARAIYRRVSITEGGGGEGEEGNERCCTFGKGWTGATAWGRGIRIGPPPLII